MFGGQLLGQCVRAAAVGVPDKSVKSLHTVFAREGRTDEPIRYRLHRHHAGRSFATGSLVAEQSRGVMATASVSLHAEEEGPHRQTLAAPAVLSAEHNVKWDLLPWETRAAGDLDDLGTAAPEFEFWMRTPEVDPALPAVIEKPSISGCSTLSEANFSGLVSRRGCSSASNRPCGVSIGTISSMNRPSSMAAMAFRQHRHDLAQRAVARPLERTTTMAGQRYRQRDGLGRCEIQRRQGHALSSAHPPRLPASA